MRKTISLLLTIISAQFCCAQISGTWKYNRMIIVRATDSIFLFSTDSLKNTFGLQNLRITFKPAGIYEARLFNGEKEEGSWKVLNGKLIADADTNDILLSTPSMLRTSVVILNTEPGFEGSGTLISEFTRLPDCSVLESLRSGDWNDPSLWSCDRVPDREDEVVIKTGHIVTLSKEMGLHNCRRLTVQSGANFIEGGKIYVTGN